MRPAFALALLVLVLLLLGGGIGTGIWAYNEEREQRQEDVRRLEERIAGMRLNLADARRQNTQLAARIRHLTTRVRRARVSLTPLAGRIRESVFTVKAAEDEGSGFVGWVDRRNTYVITANHVVVLSMIARKPFVQLLNGGRSWRGRVVLTDDENDLAVIRVPRRIAPPLWQQPVYKRPQPGDELLLVGSPLGYEGSVSVGIVSRVIRREIQTDAAAHPGISGGPAVDEDGSVVGVLVSGEAENLNFAVPINLMCVRLRRCR